MSQRKYNRGCSVHAVSLSSLSRAFLNELHQMGENLARENCIFRRLLQLFEIWQATKILQHYNAVYENKAYTGAIGERQGPVLTIESRSEGEWDWNWDVEPAQSWDRPSEEDQKQAKWCLKEHSSGKYCKHKPKRRPDGKEVNVLPDDDREWMRKIHDSGGPRQSNGNVRKGRTSSSEQGAVLEAMCTLEQRRSNPV